MPIAAAISRNRTKPFNVIRALDTDISLCCSVRQRSLQIQATVNAMRSVFDPQTVEPPKLAASFETLKL